MTDSAPAPGQVMAASQAFGNIIELLMRGSFEGKDALAVLQAHSFLRQVVDAELKAEADKAALERVDILQREKKLSVVDDKTVSESKDAANDQTGT